MSLKISDKLPDFDLKNQHNLNVSSKKFIGKNLIIFFYPKDYTPGCTTEVCNFRDNYDILKKFDAEILGISSDDIRSHKSFAKKYNIQYDLLSDPKRKVEKLFGVPRSFFGLFPGRVTYIFNKKGILIEIINSQMNINKHLNKTIKILNRLNHIK